MNDVAPRQAVLVVIGLGSNIQPRENLLRGFAALSEALDLVDASRVYETEPVDAPGAPAFLNAAVVARSARTPAELKALFRGIEARLGRVRDPENKSAPRQIDIDLLMYGDEVVRDADGDLLVPHPDIERHAYVARPLADLDLDLVHPLSGRDLREVAANFAEAEGIRPSDLELPL